MSVGIARSSTEAIEPPPYIANAGLVLLSPFLPHLFERLELLDGDPDPRVSDPENRSRAVHLLQYLVTGRFDTPESELVLNRLLAGIPLSATLVPDIAPSTADLDICDGLLKAAIHNWPIIRGTSPDGLRETFLQREGRLQQSDQRWRLVVQRKAVDVLVDQIPWSFATVFHRWMPGPVQVTW